LLVFALYFFRTKRVSHVKFLFRLFRFRFHLWGWFIFKIKSTCLFLFWNFISICVTLLLHVCFEESLFPYFFLVLIIKKKFWLHWFVRFTFYLSWFVCERIYWFSTCLACLNLFGFIFFVPLFRNAELFLLKFLGSS
jgi:hypothetical protein